MASKGYPDLKSPNPLGFADVDAKGRAFGEGLLKATRFAFVTPILIAANIIVFVWMVLSGVGLIVPTVEALLRWGANFGPLTVHGQWWRLLTCIFVHIGIVHVALNLWVLATVGRLVERLYGNGAYLFLYLMSGLVGSMASLCCNPEIICADASGALFGLYGALLAFLARRKGQIPKAILLGIRDSTVAFVGYNLVYGIIRVGVENVTHLTGLFTGFLLGLMLARTLTADGRGRLAVWRPALAAIASAALIGTLSCFIPAYIREYHNVLDWYVEEDESTTAAAGDLMRRAGSAPVPDSSAADRLEKECLVPWNRIVAKTEELGGGEDIGTRKRYNFVSHLAHLRRDALVLMIEGLRSGDRAKIKYAEHLHSRADRIVGELRRQIGKH